MRPQLSICTFLASDSLAESLTQFLGGDRYVVTHFQSEEPFFKFIALENKQLDCLILQSQPVLPQVTNRLNRQGTLLPAVILSRDSSFSFSSESPPIPPDKGTEQPEEFFFEGEKTPKFWSSGEDPEKLFFTQSSEDWLSEKMPGLEQSTPGMSPNNGGAETDKKGEKVEPLDTILVYHSAEVYLSISQISEVADFLDRAIAQFINLSATSQLKGVIETGDSNTDTTIQNLLPQHQRRLAEKLRERL